MFFGYCICVFERYCFHCWDPYAVIFSDDWSHYPHDFRVTAGGATALAAVFAVVFRKEIGSTTRDCHALPVVLQVGMPVLGKKFYIGDITIILHSVPGITLIKNFHLRILLMILAPRSLQYHHGGIFDGVFSFPSL